MSTRDLITFYRARLDDEEAAIRDCIESGEPNVSESDLADIKAKRDVVDHIEYELSDAGGSNPWWYADKLTPILEALAAPYAGHPDYREEWRPQP